MPLDPLTEIAFFESSLGTNTGSPSGSSASGIFQDLTGTWGQALAACNCGTTAQWPNAQSAPASVQFAANAALYNAKGFQPWVCSGCDAPLAAAIQTAGGPSAFSAPGSLSIDPANYSVDTSAGLQAYFAQNGGATVTSTAPDGSTLSFPTISTPGASVISVTTTSNVTPFTYMWNAYQNTVRQTLTETVGTIQSNANGTLGGLIVLDVAILGACLVYGLASKETFFAKLFRAGLVVSLLGATNLYNDWIVQFFTDFPNTAGHWFGLSAAGPGAFDQLLYLFLTKTNDALTSMPYGIGSWMEGLAVVVVAMLIFGPALGALWLTFFLSQILTEVLFLIGPLLCLALLWDYTRHLFDLWISALIHLALTAFVSVILTSVVLKLVIQSVNAVTKANGGLSETQSLLGIAFATFGLGAVVSAVPFILSHITRGAVGAASIWRSSGANTVSNAPAAIAGAAVGAAMAAPAAIARATFPAGSSLSRG